MVIFEQIGDSNLFQAQTSADDLGWLGMTFPQNVKPPSEPVTFAEVLHSSKLKASLVFTLKAPVFDPENSLDDFIGAIYEVINRSQGNRNFIWLEGKAWQADFAAIPDLDPPVLPFDTPGEQTIAPLTVNLSDSLSFVVHPNDAIGYEQDNDCVSFTQQIGAVELSGASAPVFGAANTAYLYLSGESRGRISCGMDLQRPSMLDKLGWGFQYLMSEQSGPDGEETAQQLVEYAPLASGSEPAADDWLSFTSLIDSRDPLNRYDPTYTGTAFYFSGDNLLVSYYRTNFGHTINLLPISNEQLQSGEQPARFVVEQGLADDAGVREFHFSPVGDFVMQVAEGTPEQDIYRLQCGLAGVENIGFLSKTDSYAGYRMRFFPGHAAYAPVFPIPESSPVGPPVKTNAPLLEPKFKTSWATVLPADAESQGLVPYVAQPKGSNLFGKNAQGGAANDLAEAVLDPADPAVVLPDDQLFPLIPYAAVTPSANSLSMSVEQIQEYEQQIVSPTRRTIIGGTPEQMRSSARAALGLSATNTEGVVNITTPSGVIAGLDQASGAWQSIILGKNFDPVERTMGFVQPDTALQQVFQTSDLFMVAANPANLGSYSNFYCQFNSAGDRQFENTMNVEGWVMAANVGRGNTYNSYRNIMIVKGSKGRLVDMVQSPSKWTQKEEFSAPVSLDCQGDPKGCGEAEADEGQLVILAQWISDYFDEALAQDNEYFNHFKQIILDKNWTGILVLKADITQIPTDLAGITQGVDIDEFYAHHFGINISPVDGTDVSITQSSSVFGLIYYVDPLFNDKAEQPRPVAPPPNVQWDFKVLTLKALFENTAVKQFESFAQVTLNEIFSDQVTGMKQIGSGNPEDADNNFNSMLLQGAYQQNGDASVYSLASVSEVTYALRGTVLPRVEIDTAQMSTLDDGLISGQVVSWIGMTGYMNFADVSGETKPFDVFSFGAVPGSTAARQGLAFGGLGLQLSHPFTDPADGSIDLISNQLSFDQSNSTSRPHSLVSNFALAVRGFITSDAENPPNKLGYLPVIPDAGFSGLGAGVWNGLVLRVNLGSPGALAGKVGLDSDLLLAWAPGVAAPDDRVSNDGGDPNENTYNAQIGLSLPGSSGGAPLISLQTVMKLSVGMIRLIYIDDNSTGEVAEAVKADAEGQSGFLLLLTDIALKFLGLLKIPPNGSTAFYLFGNDQGGGNSGDDNSGVGWYAIYNQDKPQSNTQAVTTRRLTGRQRSDGRSPDSERGA